MIQTLDWVGIVCVDETVAGDEENDCLPMLLATDWNLLDGIDTLKLIGTV